MSLKSPRLFLVFAVLLAAALVFVVSRGRPPAPTDAESAAYAEIVALYQSKNMQGTRDKCDLFLRNYPESSRFEPVAALAGETLVQSGKWQEAGACFRDLEKRFPKSQNMDRYVFYQAKAFFQQGKFKESSLLFEQLLRTCPNSPLIENALYYNAMSNFLGNKYKETLVACKEYLTRFPDGHYARDMHYRLSFIDFNNKEVDQSEKIIRELGDYLKDHPDDLANGSILCLMGDTYKRKKTDPKADPETQAKVAQANEDVALECYKKAVLTESLDDIMQYALNEATALMRKKKDWTGIADMHEAFMKRRTDTQLVEDPAPWNKLIREGKAAEAAEFLASILKERIADPAAEQVEFFIDELVKTLVPRKMKAKDVDLEAIDKQLVVLFNKIIAGQKNATTAARFYYARARLAQMLKRNDLSDLYLKGIATTYAQDPSAISPTLLAVSGDVLVKAGELDGAEAMFRRLRDCFPDSKVADAAPVGLGDVALARKQYEEALKIFDDALKINPGMSRFKEATLGKLRALVGLERFVAAEKLALEIIGNKLFRVEAVGKAYLQLARIYREKAAKAVGPEATNLLKKALACYQRVEVAYRLYPEIRAEASWEVYQTALELGDEELAEKTLKALME